MSIVPNIIKVFAAYKCNDEYHRDRVILGYFTIREDAIETVKGQGWFGGNGEVDEAWVLRPSATENYVLASPYPVQLNVNLVEQKANRKRAAIQKLKATLSDGELKELGINVDLL